MYFMVDNLLYVIVKAPLRQNIDVMAQCFNCPLPWQPLSELGSKSGCHGNILYNPL